MKHGSALEKAIRILRMVAQAGQPIALDELTRSLGLPKQTIHRTLMQLLELRLILRTTGKGRYVVGPSMMQLATTAIASLGAQPPIRAVLQKLAEQTGETCNVGILDQHEVIYIERVEGTSPLRLQLQVGSQVPGYCTAIGKLLIAHKHKNTRKRILAATSLVQHTPRTLVNVDTLEREFANIRSKSYSINNQEYVEGLVAAAVPIHDTAEDVVAALAIHAPSARMDLDKAVDCVPLMREHAREIERSLKSEDTGSGPKMLHFRNES